MRSFQGQIGSCQQKKLKQVHICKCICYSTFVSIFIYLAKYECILRQKIQSNTYYSVSFLNLETSNTKNGKQPEDSCTDCEDSIATAIDTKKAGNMHKLDKVLDFGGATIDTNH